MRLPPLEFEVKPPPGNCESKTALWAMTSTTLQQIVDGSKSVIRPLAVRIGPARTTTFGES
jgi:hypothetical protein